MSLRVGQRAPDFDLTSSAGQPLRLAELRGKKNVVLYFYPADFTTVCTRETCGFRDAYEDLARKDTEIIGVSVDSDASHEKFAAEHKVLFPLVSDAGMTLARKYEAASLFRTILGKTARVTYVIDKKGMIAGVFDSELRASVHVDGVKSLIAKLA